MDIKQINVVDKRPSTIHDKLRGRVQIFETLPDGTRKLRDTNNLVVYMGRNWLMQRAVNLNQDLSAGVNSYISWLGLGIGGATTGDPLTPLTPNLTNVALGQQIVINDSISTNCVDGGKLHPFDSIAFSQDENNQDEYLVADITTTILDNEANGPSGATGPAAYYDISEAGLFISNSNDPLLFDPTSVKLFARVTFSSIRKYVDRQLVFVWKIFF